MTHHLHLVRRSRRALTAAAVFSLMLAGMMQGGGSPAHAAVPVTQR
jgi:hypothetical protein